MKIKYFVEYKGEVYGHYMSSKMVPHNQDNYDVYHKIIKMEESPNIIKRKYPNTSYRLFTTDKITKFVKAKIKYYDGPFSLNSDDLQPLQEFGKKLLDIEPNTFLILDTYLKKLNKDKSKKMRQLLITELVISRDLLESNNNWQLSDKIKEYHRGRIDLLKNLLEITV